MTRAAVLLSFDGPGRQWFDTQIRAIEHFTSGTDVYVSMRSEVAANQGEQPTWLTVVERTDGATDGERWQRLYEVARENAADIVVALDADTLPASPDWLANLTAAVRGGAAVSGVWSDARASCVCTSIAFLERHRVRFDGRSAIDALSVVVEAARASGEPTHAFGRISPDGLADFPGALYGDALYVHDSELSATSDDLPRRLVIDHFHELFEWMRRTQSAGVCFVLGMHRSGTSVLTASLEQCGLYLGKAYRRPSPDQPRGHFERRDTMILNDKMLARAGGTWRKPPSAPIEPSAPEMRRIGSIADDLATRVPSGVKDPRFLLTIEPWLRAVDASCFVGTFRHPEAVARSLWKRNRIPHDEAHQLWRIYNERLVDLHRQHHFPIIEFDLSEPAEYAERVAAVALELGLHPRRDAVLALLDGSPKAAADDEEVPQICRETYEYLRSNRHELSVDRRPFVRLLTEWEGEHHVPAVIDAPRRGERLIFDVGRQLPRPLRRVVWRLWSSTGGRPRSR